MSGWQFKPETDVGPFLTGLGLVTKGFRATQAHMDRVVATRFSVFRYFNYNENIISGIFADLLRPEGTHGQGSVFLSLFLDEMDRGRGRDALYWRAEDYKEALSRCVVETEHVIGENRRIDIVLRFEDPRWDARWIGIENKPWGVEEEKQLADYAEYLHGQDSRACVLYLSGDGSDSETIPEEKQAYYRVMSYRQTNEKPSVEWWIKRCMEHCDADKVRWFFKDMSGYIRHAFREETSLEEAEDE